MASDDTAALLRQSHNALTCSVEQASSLDKMLQALLDLSRIEKGQLSIKSELVLLFTLATYLINQLFFSLKDHAIHFHCEDESVAVMGDKLQLEQALQNLIQNAIKYSPHGGPVRVRLYKENGFAVLSVGDQGIGLPLEDLPHI